MNGFFKCGTHTHTLTRWPIIQSRKEGSPAVYDNMDEPGEHYAK